MARDYAAFLLAKKTDCFPRNSLIPPKSPGPLVYYSKGIDIKRGHHMDSQFTKGKATCGVC